MSRRARGYFFLISGAALALFFALALMRLEPAGAGSSRYGDLVNALTVPELHVTDAVTAVNFAVRGFDTLGEEFILFAAVAGVVVLMRRQSDEAAGDHEDHLEGRAVPPASDAVRVTALMLIAPTVLFGLYLVTHGGISPGGGFPGGAVLATAPILLYLCAEFRRFREAAPERAVEMAEGLGAGAYAVIGLASIAAGGLFLQNFLPLGTSGTITGGGIVPLISLAVGVEVGGGLTRVLLAYLEELVEEKEA